MPMPKDLLKSNLRIWRETDAVAVNIILNNPEVRPWVADMGEGAIDISDAVADQNNVLLMGEHGAIFFICIMPGTYECHTQILPKGRGEWASKFAISVLDWMFSRTNAWEITTRVPAGHLGALTLARSVGFRHEFTAMDKFMFRGALVTASILRLSIHDWVVRSDYFYQLGEKLHAQMASEAERLGIKTPAHESDAYHDQVAGAAIEMARNGLMTKALYFYNRWSILGRHRPISVVSVEPPVVRMDLGDMRITKDGIEIAA
jgi:hypothetical protein